MTQVNLSEKQAQIVLQALDQAIRAGGANTAIVVLPIMQEIEAQLRQGKK